MPVEDCDKKAADLAFDVTKQFLTLALAGITFVVGLSFSTPGTVSSFMLWITVSIFGASVVFGLFFLLHGVNLLSVQKSYDVYASSLRFLTILQIALVLLGVGLLTPILNLHPPKKETTTGSSIEIRSGPQQGTIYKLDPDRDVTVEIDGGKVKITAIKK